MTGRGKDGKKISWIERKEPAWGIIKRSFEEFKVNMNDKWLKELEEAIEKKDIRKTRSIAHDITNFGADIPIYLKVFDPSDDIGF